MKTKLLTIFVMAFLATSFMVGIVAAENDLVLETENSVNVDDLDSSGIFWNQFQRAFTFKKEKKAEISLKIAEKRMAKVAQLAKKGKKEKANEEAKEYEQELEKAEEYMEKVEINGDENETEKSLVAIAALQNKMSSHQEKVEAIHNAILEQQAEKLSEEQLAHLENVFGTMKSKLEESEGKVFQKQENIRVKYKLQTGKTDEEIEEELGLESKNETKAQIKKGDSEENFSGSKNQTVSEKDNKSLSLEISSKGNIEN